MLCFIPAHHHGLNKDTCFKANFPCTMTDGSAHRRIQVFDEYKHIQIRVRLSISTRPRAKHNRLVERDILLDHQALELLDQFPVRVLNHGQYSLTPVWRQLDKAPLIPVRVQGKTLLAPGVTLGLLQDGDAAALKPGDQGVHVIHLEVRENTRALLCSLLIERPWY